MKISENDRKMFSFHKIFQNVSEDIHISMQICIFLNIEMRISIDMKINMYILILIKKFQ